MMYEILTIFSIFFLFIVWLCSSIPGNYRKARATGLPVYITFTNPSAPGWIVITNLFGYGALQGLLPSFIFNRVKTTVPGWEFHCRYQVATTRGLTWIAVTTGENMLMTSDPRIGHAVLHKRRRLLRPAIASQILSKFGPNVFSEDNENWQRHRKLVAPMLNEQIMNAVWNESTRQARQMMESFRGPLAANQREEPNETNETPGGFKTITMSVIASAAFGRNTTWATYYSNEQVPPGYQMGFFRGIALLTRQFFIALVVPVPVLTSFLMPKSMRELGAAVHEFPMHAKDIIAEERRSSNVKNSMVSAMVKVADQSKEAEAGSIYLSEEEILGNLFAFMIAGFDTTSNTLTYAVMLLTIYPQWQDWIIAGIDEANKQSSENSYKPTWELLTRVRALMFETLRLYTPISQVARVASEDLVVHDTIIPKDTTVQVAAAVIHVSPEHWGPDALEFRPSRWCIGPHPEGLPVSESLLGPLPGTYMPWSLGPRYCPGNKMSQVEFVGVMREIFSNYRVEPTLGVGENMQMARDRLNRVLLNSSPGLSLQIREPHNVALKWIPRAKDRA